MKDTANHEEIRQMMAEYVSKFPTKKEAAAAIGICPAYLTGMLNGYESMTDRIAEHFGYERVTFWRRK